MWSDFVNEVFLNDKNKWLFQESFGAANKILNCQYCLDGLSECIMLNPDRERGCKKHSICMVAIPLLLMSTVILKSENKEKERQLSSFIC